MLADETSRLQVLIRKKQENAIIVLMPNKQANKKDAEKGNRKDLYLI